VVMTQADAGRGIEELWQTLEDHQSHLSESGLLETRRSDRRRLEFLEIIVEELKNRLDKHILHSRNLNIIIDSVSNGESEPYSEAMSVLEGVFVNLDIPDSRK
jgi:LAO/AO transport system kinase